MAHYGKSSIRFFQEIVYQFITNNYFVSLVVKGKFERKISVIKKSQNIMNMIVGALLG